MAAKKELPSSLQAQLALGCFDLFTVAFNYSRESLLKFLNDETRIYLNNRRYYYLGLSYYK